MVKNSPNNSDLKIPVDERADVVIVRPSANSWEQESYLRLITIPHGPLSLSGHLVKEGIPVQIIDQVAEEDAEGRLKKLLEGRPVCVGISSMTGMQLKNGLRFSKIVRDFDPGIPIIWGGAHPTILPDLTVENPYVDIAVFGEADLNFVDLVKRIKNNQDFSDVTGLCFFKDGEKIKTGPTPHFDLAMTPPVPYHLINMEKYLQGIKKKNIDRYFEVISSRGCPYKCTFCTNSIKGIPYARRNADNIVDEIKYLVDNYQVDGISLSDENFLISKRQIEHVCNGILDANLNIKVRSSGRIDLFSRLDDSHLELMSKAGFYFFAFGVESGSVKTLKLMHKEMKIEQVYDVLERVNRFGFLASYNFLGGIPGETVEDFKDTLKIIHDVFYQSRRSVYPNRISNFTPFPGTALYNDALKSGFVPPHKFEEWGNYDYHHRNMPWISDYFIDLLVRAKHIVSDINQKFTGDESEISDEDLQPILALIEECDTRKALAS